MARSFACCPRPSRAEKPKPRFEEKASATRAAAAEVAATKGGLAFRAEYGGGVTMSIRSGCVDASKDVISKLTDEPVKELNLTLPK